MDYHELRRAAQLLEQGLALVPRGSVLRDEQRLAIRRAASDLKHAADEGQLDDFNWVGSRHHY